jgi:hypothetical protein
MMNIALNSNKAIKLTNFTTLRVFGYLFVFVELKDLVDSLAKNDLYEYMLIPLRK